MLLLHLLLHIGQLCYPDDIFDLDSQHTKEICGQKSAKPRDINPAKLVFHL